MFSLNINSHLFFREDPEHVDESTKCKGDGDPIDVCEIGQRVHKRGAVIEVRVKLKYWVAIKTVYFVSLVKKRNQLR